MATLWWGLGCFAVAALLAWFVAVPAVKACEEERYGLHAPVRWALFSSWLVALYALIGVILVSDYFWPWG